MFAVFAIGLVFSKIKENQMYEEKQFKQLQISGIRQNRYPANETGYPSVYLVRAISVRSYEFPTIFNPVLITSYMFLPVLRIISV